MTPWLVLDTSTPVAVVGVVDVVDPPHPDAAAPVVLAEEALGETRKHAELLLDAIDRALAGAKLKLADIRGVGVGVGPGSFIGVRTGIATAKGLCLGRGIPLVGLPSLVALAAGAVAAREPAVPFGVGLAVVDAKRGEVYAQLVEHLRDGRVVARAPAAAMKPADAAARGASLAFVVGQALPDAAVIRASHASAAGLARALMEHQRSGPLVDELRELAPDYCRGADAKLPAVDPGARRGEAVARDGK